MGRKGMERVSQREYARRLGVSNTAVANAIEDGKIVKGWDKKAKKIIVGKANEEWGNIHLAANQEHLNEQQEIIKGVHSYNPEATRPEPAPKKIEQSQKPKLEPDDTFAEAVLELENFNLNSKTTFAEALRVEKVAKAKMAELELKKAMGDLVVKDEVYKQLFAFGQEVRQAILVVPDRCIDAVIAAKNRSEAHNTLLKELHEALEKLTSPKLDFQPRQ